MPLSILCKIIRHRPVRRRVWHDSINFRAKCSRCGHSLIKDDLHWREYDAERDANPMRIPHPRHNVAGKSAAKRPAAGAQISYPANPGRRQSDRHMAEERLPERQAAE